MCPHPVTAILGLLLVVAGCSQQPLRPDDGGTSPLAAWVETELAPAVSRQLGQHPRFRNEPVIIVRLEGDDIQPDIDGLTGSIRDRLQDSLLQTPGVLLPWQPGQPPAQHHRRLEQVRCGRVREASYYLGIEIKRTATTRFRVSLRVLDVQDGEWVSGLSHQWTGILTAAELRALQARRTDESLRGLRALPFDAGDPDLAASYLANNLSCLLRQQDEEDIRISVKPLATKQPELRTLLGLVGNNLSRYREVEITDSARQAEFILRGETHRIQPGLYQVWVILQPRDSGLHLAGMDTATWIRIPSGGPQRVAAVPRTGKPAIARVELVRHANRQDYRAACDDHLQDCPVLEVDVEDADAVFVLAHGTRDGISRLSGNCSLTDTAPSPAGRLAYRFPEGRFDTTDWTTVYAIAVRGSEAGQQFRALLADLPDACGAASGRPVGTARSDPWLDRLDQWMAANHAHAMWTARRLP